MTNSSAEREPIINQYGSKFWKNEAGKLHRADGPAVEYPSGTKFWYIDGNLHRVGGPAIEWSNGIKYWFIDGKEYSETEYNALRCTVCVRIDCPTKEK